MKASVLFLGGIACLVLWVVLAFVMAIPRGWVHLPLAVGASLVAMGITLTEPAGSKPPR